MRVGGNGGWGAPLGRDPLFVLENVGNGPGVWADSAGDIRSGRETRRVELRERSG